MQVKKHTEGLKRSLSAFIQGIDSVERYIGTDFLFHDAEIDSVSINRDGTVVLKIRTWSDVDYSKNYMTTWTLRDCVDVSAYNYDPGICYLYDISFELCEQTSDRIKVILDGTGLDLTCKGLTIEVEEIN